MTGTIRDDIQRRIEEALQREADAEHDVGVLTRRIERAADARDLAYAQAKELAKLAEFMGFEPKPPRLSSAPEDELIREAW